jgi:hypothetical protein
MARGKNTFVKRQREMLKKQKSKDKLTRRKVRKERVDDAPPAPEDVAAEPVDSRPA